MALDTDDVLGSTYIDVADFEDRAGMFGVGLALPDSDSTIAAYLAAASRFVDARCNRRFDPDVVYTEQHKWNFETRRVFPYNAPVSAISDYRIYVGPSTYATIPTSAIFVNNSFRFVEVASLTAATSLTSQLLSIGLFEPFVQITYQSTTDVEPHIALATGYIAAAMMNQSYLSASLPPGVKSIKIGSQAALTLGESSSKVQSAQNTLTIPKVVDALLSSESAIGVA